MFKQIFLPLILVALFITVVGLLNQNKLNFLVPKALTVAGSKVININDVEVNVEVAKTNEERSKGLSNRNELAPKSGMIFVFNKDTIPVFWMKDTKIPLDLIWINDNKITKIDFNVQPEPGVTDNKLKRYAAPSATDYVLEVNGGFSEKNGIKAGQSLSGLEQL